VRHGDPLPSARTAGRPGIGAGSVSYRLAPGPCFRRGQGRAAEALLGHTAGFYVLRSLAWPAAIIVVFAPLAVARYRRG